MFFPRFFFFLVISPTPLPLLWTAVVDAALGRNERRTREKRTPHSAQMNAALRAPPRKNTFWKGVRTKIIL